MKKLIKVLSIGFLAFSLTACSCKKEEKIQSTLQNSTQVSNVTLTTQDIYNYMRTNEDTVSQVNKEFLQRLMYVILNISENNTNKEIYNLKVKEYFEENFLNSDEYKINGVFNEELLVASLKKDLYKIDTSVTTTSGVTYDLGLKYDYSDYISRALDYDIYLEMIKKDYISTYKQALLNNSKTRIISIFSTDDIEDMEEIVEKLFAGEYTSLEDVAQIKKDEAIKEIGRQYCLNLGYDNQYYEGTCYASTSSSTYDSALSKFTTCENDVRCTPSEGLAYQIKLINETEYVKEQVVNKNTTDILYEKALEQLFRSDVENYLYKVIENEDKFLINSLYNDESTFNKKNIILFDGSSDNYYLVTVRVVDSNTQNILDQEKGYEELLSKIGETALIDYLENLDIEITDPVLKEYYNSLIGK